jgi:hypothetical protein
MNNKRKYAFNRGDVMCYTREPYCQGNKYIVNFFELLNSMIEI